MTFQADSIPFLPDVPVAFGSKTTPSLKVSLGLTCDSYFPGLPNARNRSTNQVFKYLYYACSSASAAEVLRKNKGFSYRKEQADQGLSDL